MAPTPADELSAPGAVSYDSNTMTVGDGTWDFSKNTFLLPNLQGLDFETMRYNGMGNRFSTLTQYHTLIRAHAIMGAMIFLFLIPFSVMTVRFYASRPGWAVKYHAQINIFAGMMLLAVFLLGYFAVGSERSLTNPHHGIGVAIFAMFILQLVGGRLIKSITKIRSLRIMIHQWTGRAIALLGIVQVPLGLTLYGSPKYLFILYAIWMGFLLLVYFILSYQSEGRREFYMSGARSGRTEDTRTRVTESEYFASDHKTDHGGKAKWLGPLAAVAGLWALTRGRNKNKSTIGSRSRSPSLDRSRRTDLTRTDYTHTDYTQTDLTRSRRGSASYLTDKYSELPPARKASGAGGGGGGGFMKFLGGAAAAIGAGKLVSGLMNRREDRRREEEYSAISTETPRKYRSTRSAPTETDFTSDYTETTRREPERTRTSLNPPPRNVAATTATRSEMRSDLDSRLSSEPATRIRSELDSRLSSQPPTTPRRATHPHRFSKRSFDESDYSSYVSPSRRPVEEHKSSGLAGGFFGGFGLGWFAKKLADRRAQKEEQRLRDEEDVRSGTSVSRFTGDGHPSPTRKPSHRPPPQRRQTGYAPAPRTETILSDDMTESTIEPRPPRGNYIPPTEVSTVPPSTLPASTLPPSTMPPSMPTIVPVPASGGHASRSRQSMEHVNMPSMPPDPQGILADSDVSGISPGMRHHRSRQGRPPVATQSDLPIPEDRVRYSSPASLSVKLKVHDDRNVTLRRLTEEEAAKARGRRDSESSISGLESPTSRRYRRRESSQKRTESAAERRADDDEHLETLSPPNPAFAKTRRAKDSAYYSGQAPQNAPSGSLLPPVTPSMGQTVSSLGSESHGEWGGSPSPPGPEKPTPAGSAADNRRRRRLERRRASEASNRPSGTDMFD